MENLLFQSGAVPQVLEKFSDIVTLQEQMKNLANTLKEIITSANKVERTVAHLKKESNRAKRELRLLVAGQKKVEKAIVKDENKLAVYFDAKRFVLSFLGK